MSQSVWISSLLVVGLVFIGVRFQPDVDTAVESLVYVEEPRSASSDDARRLEDGSIGSALATAAFGLSALQPETFNSEIVLDIIDASPLEYAEKDRLTAKLIAAKTGQAELPRVLADIRESLAVE